MCARLLPVNPEQFLTRCPTLWHVGPVGSWEGIRRDGFRTAEQLIQAADLTDEERHTLRTEPRAKSVDLKVDGNHVRLRDQASLLARKDLPAILGDEVTVAEWIEMLNARVYLYADSAAMKKARDKYIALDGAQEVVTFSPRRFFDMCRPRIELSAQNSGSIQRITGSQKRRDAFVSVGMFPDKRPSEVTVRDGIDDLSCVVFVERIHSDGRVEKLPC